MFASVTATRGGLSNKTISQSFSKCFTNFAMRSEPKSSEGFGGIIPAVIILRFGIWLSLIKFL